MGSFVQARYVHWRTAGKCPIHKNILVVVQLFVKVQYSYLINPFTAPARKISGLKSAHARACKQYISFSCITYTYNTEHFDRNPFRCSCKGVKIALTVSNLALISVVLRVMARQVWQ